MKIKARLVLLNGISVVFSLGTVLTYFFIMSSLVVLEEEQRIFDRLNMATMDVEIQMTRLATETVSDQYTLLKKSRESFQSALADVDKVTAISAINSDMADAIKALGAMGKIAETSFENLDTSITDILADAKEVYGSDDAGTLFSIYNQARVDGSEYLDQIAFHTSFFHRALSDQHTTMQGISSKINQTSTMVSEAITGIRNNTTFVSIIVVVVMLAGLVGLSALVSSSITRTLRRIQARIQSMSTGDLSSRFRLEGNDEIADLGKNLNVLLGMLHQSLGKTKDIARRNTATKDQLLSSVESASTSVVQIDANTESIAKQMEHMDEMIQGSGGNLTMVAQGTEVFASRIKAREREVADSVSSVTRMMTSIQNITRIAEQDQKAASMLVDEAENGRKVFEDSFEQIGRIGDQVELIQEMATVISDIASQTNILSMNAAIEAAHAGEAGKGFAVVADEISKLASASAESSVEITASIRSITEQVKVAVGTRQLTATAFDNISAKIRDVDTGITEICRSIAEMQSGSRQILSAMEELRDDSSYLSGEAGKIDEATRSLASSFEQVTRVSSEVASSIGEISSGLRLITTSVYEVREAAARIGDLGKNLEESVQVFTIEDHSSDSIDELPEA